MINSTIQEVFNEKEAASYLRISPKTLQKWRSVGVVKTSLLLVQVILPAQFFIKGSLNYVFLTVILFEGTINNTRFLTLFLCKKRFLLHRNTC